MAALGRADDWNRNLLVALRCKAILARLGSVSRSVYKLRKRLDKRVINAFGPIVAEKLEEILHKVKKRRGKALAAFTALLRDDDGCDNGRGRGRKPGENSNGKATDNPMRIIKLPMPETCNSAVKRTALARSGARLNRAD